MSGKINIINGKEREINSNICNTIFKNDVN